MAVGGEQNLDELLKRLSSVKRLPAAEQPFRTQQAAVGSRIRDVSRGAPPRLADLVQQVQQGGTAQTGWKGAVAGALGSPVGKVIMGGLNVIDMPRRAVISTVKEAKDALDSNPETRASLNEAWDQFKDPSFGFGRVLPGKGWGGRIVGFIGDVALDPTTYLTLGATVPVKAIAKGAGTAGVALRAGAKIGAEDVLLRAALGTKNVSGREGRFALANLVKQYGGNADEVAKVASHGKSAVPDDIAKVMGLQRNGLYMFGSRVRLPGSGRIGSALETGLVKARLGITNTNIGKKLQYLYTPRGAVAQFGNMNQVRADLASGRLAPERADMIMSALTGGENARSRGASYGAQSLRDATTVGRLDDVQKFDDEIHKFIESSDPISLSPNQVAAKRAVQDFLEQKRQLMIVEGRSVDPDFDIPVGMVDEITGEPRYFPHIVTDDFIRYQQRNATDPWVLKMEAQGSVDVMDARNNLAARYFEPGQNFLDTDYVLRTASVEEINTKWREYTGLDFDLFETKASKVLARYSDTVRGAFETFTLMKQLGNDDFIKLLREQGEVDPAFLNAMQRMSATKMTAVQRSATRVAAAAQELVRVVKKDFGADSKSSIVTALNREAAGLARDVSAGERAVERIGKLQQRINDLALQQQNEARSLAALFEDSNLVMHYMEDAVDRAVKESVAFGQQADSIKALIADKNASAAELQSSIAALEKRAADVDAAQKRAERIFDYYRIYGDEIGPALQSIYDRIRSAASDNDVAGIVKAGEKWERTGDARVDGILDRLMRPFDSIDYQNTSDLGEDWLRDSVNSTGDVGALLKSIPDLGDPAGGRTTRAGMARAGKDKKRHISAQGVNEIIGRASTIGDNPAAVADAFFFMTARELRAAFDNAGGGINGLAAQNELAKELAEGVSSRAKLWQEARNAVKYVEQQNKVLREIGSRKNQSERYQFAAETVKRLDELDQQIDEANRGGLVMAQGVSSSLDEAKLRLNELGTSSESAMSVVAALHNVLREVRSAKPQLAEMAEFASLDFVIRRSHDLIADLQPVSKEGMTELYERFDKFVRGNFSNEAQVARLQAAKQRLEREASEALKLDKQFTNVSMELLQSSRDAGIKLSNYHIIHAARLAVDAINALTPADSAIGEALYKFALSGAARQQLGHVRNFERTKLTFENVMSEIKTRVLGAPKQERALLLRQAVEELGEHDRAAVYAMVGDLSFVEKQKAVATRIETVRRNTDEYVRVRDQIIDMHQGENWKNQVELMNQAGYARTQRRVGGFAFGEGQRASRMALSDEAVSEMSGFELGLDDVVTGSEAESMRQAQLLKEAKNRINSLLNAAPKKLLGMIDDLVSRGTITASEATGLRYAVTSAEAAAKKAQKEALARVGATGKGAREAARTAAGVLRSGDESFGVARAYWLATRTNADGSTNSPQRVLDFFTYVFGEGDVRVSNSGGWKRPSAQLSGEEVAYAANAKKIIAAAQQERAAETAQLRARGMGRADFLEAQKNLRFKYWERLIRDLDLDSSRIMKLLQDLEDANDVVKMRRAVLRTSRSENKPSAEIAENFRLLKASEKRASLVRSQLQQEEVAATQLVTRGTATPEQTFKFISYGDSVIGRAGSQIQLRSAALRALAQDPEVAVSFNVATGVDGGIGLTEVLSGPFGYVEFLRGHVRELEAAANATEAAGKNLETLERGVAKGRKSRQQNIADAEAIANNPVLAKRVQNAIDVVSDDEEVRTAATRALASPQKISWLSAQRLGAAKGEVPDKVRSLVNRIRSGKQKMAEIEKTAEYTTALERQFRHKFIAKLARLNLADSTLEFPQNSFDENTVGALRSFASRGSGAAEGLNADSLMVFNTREVVFDDVVDTVLNQKASQKSRYTFLVGDRRVTEQVVRDATLMRNRSKFRYAAKVIDEKIESSRLDPVTGKSIVESANKKRLVYVDKGTGREFAFGEDAGNVVDGQELVFDQPVYFGKSQQLTDEYQLVSGGNMTVLERQERLSTHKDGYDHYDPTQAHVFFTSPNGERVYRMDSIVGVKAARGTDPLDPNVVFDPAQGRGVRENFDSLFVEPESPLSATGKKARAAVEAKREEYRKVAARHAKHLDDMGSARTESARREAQRRAAVESDKMQALASEIEDMSREIANSNPVTRMVTVESVIRVIDYFRNNPALLSRLGVKVDAAPTTVDSLGRTVRVAGPARPASDDQVLKAFETYVTALEHGQMRPKRAYKKANIEKKNSVPATEVQRRVRVLNGVWNESEQGILIATHNGLTRKVAALVKELDTLANGGDDAITLMALRAGREELARTERILGLESRELGKALREKRVRRMEGETVAQAAERVIAEKEAALRDAPVLAMKKAVTKDARDAAQMEVDLLASHAWFDEVYSQDAKNSLMIIRADIAARESILETMKKKGVMLQERIDAMVRVINGGTNTPAQAKRLTDEFKDLRLQLEGTKTVPGLKKQIDDASAEVARLHKERKGLEAKLLHERSAVDAGNYSDLSLDDARKRLDLVKVALEDMKAVRRGAKKPKGKGDGWMTDFDEFAAEVDDLVQRLNGMPDGPDTKRIASALTGYAEAKANLLREQADLTELQVMAKNGSMFAPGSHMVFSRVLDEGWVQLTGSGSLASFKNLQMRPEVAEIFGNMGRMRDPAFVKMMNAWVGPYTRFFKAWALSTPGYHVRNALTNAFMMIAAGGRIKYLNEGMREYNSLYKALKSGTSIENYLASLPVERRQFVGRAYEAMLGSGVGQTEEIAFDSAGALTNNPWTRGNRRAGVWLEQHSRFMLSYDGIRQGLDVNGATARTRKFLFDYEDVSTLDTYMRSIIPFWMWTSRNFPLTIQNIYMNPRAYQWYGSLRRNLEDEEKTAGLPLYMRESGNFALPGTTLAATPDLGFNRQQADVAMLADPTRFAANVNPALRIPVELLAGKSFFRNREFAEAPVEVSGPVGRLASVLGMPLGKGQIQGGRQYVDENLLYALTNAVPLLNTAERFIPSQEYYQQRGSTNPLLGFLGAPVRQVTPEMTTNEQKRRLAEIQKLLRSQPQPEGQ